MLGLIWGSGYVIANYCVHNGVKPLGYALWQSLGPAMALLLISIFRHTQSIRFEKKYLNYYLVCGLFGVAFPNTLIYFTSQHLPPGIVGVIVNIVPIIIYALALFWRQENFRWWRLFAVLVGVSGVMTIVIPHVHINTAAGIPWILLILLTPLSFALCAVFIARFRPVPSDSLGLSTGMLIISSLLLTPIVLSTHDFYAFHFPFTTIDWLLVLETLLSTTGYVIFFLLIRRAGPVYYSLVSGVVALTSVFWSWLIFHQIPSFMSAAGIALIVTSIGMITLCRTSSTSSNAKTAVTTPDTQPT